VSVAGAASKHLRTDAVDVVLLNPAPVALAGRVRFSAIMADRDLTRCVRSSATTLITTLLSRKVFLSE
jgi:hypothetical protein